MFYWVIIIRLVIFLKDEIDNFKNFKKLLKIIINFLLHVV